MCITVVTVPIALFLVAKRLHDQLDACSGIGDENNVEIGRVCLE
jgi:hypothetical protein